MSTSDPAVDRAPRPRRRRRLVAAVCAVLVVACAAVAYVVYRAIPDYRTELLVDASDGGPAARAGVGAVTAAVGAAARTAGDHDALALRRFGGECGNSANTAQLVSSGTDRSAAIVEAARGITARGNATLYNGILAAIDDFGHLYPLRARNVNRIVVVSRSGTDACAPDPSTMQEEIRKRLDAAGIRLEFRLIGFQIPADQHDGLIQVAAATKAPQPEFVQTEDALHESLNRLVVPQTRDAAFVEPSPGPLSSFAGSSAPPSQSPPSEGPLDSPVTDPSADTPTFLETTKRYDATLLARGFMVNVMWGKSELHDGQPQVVVETELTNQLWGIRSGSQQSPPDLELHQGGRVYPAGGPTDQNRTYARGHRTRATYVVSVDQSFRLDEADVVFPVSRDAEPARIVKGGADLVSLVGLAVTYRKNTLESGRIHLTFGYDGKFRRDARMYAEGGSSNAENGTCDFDRAAPEGLGRNKGSLKLYFDLDANPGPAGFNVDELNYTLTTPDGRSFHPDSAESLAVYPESSHLKRLAIATQLPLPATGTYTLSFVDRDGKGPRAPADKLTFTLS
ncbi:hypothetical protein [Krasilnikovia sp. M28-CT-15]|uniref:hypothetical protein n=1 Tax=Krasilnikovia sp. M28-CT-15 TaxID=3373540 RepID=UPI003876BB26